MIRKFAVIVMALLWMSDISSGQLIIAHRGASGDAPENTLAAFQLAWDQEADGIEGDFRVTADGAVVCLHDPDTGRVSGGAVQLEVARSTLEQLRAVDVGSWKSPKFAGQKIPTLSEVLGLVRPGKLFFLEIKGGAELVPPIAQVLRESGTNLSQVVIIAFDPLTIAEVRRHIPEVRTYWLVSYQRDKTTGQWKPTVDEILATLRAIGAHGLDSQANPAVVDQQFVRTIREAGFELHVWTVNDEALARHFQNLGVDSITTDYPERIRRALRTSSAQPEQKARAQPADSN